MSLSPRHSSLAMVRAAFLVALLTALVLTLAYQVRARVTIDIGGAYDVPFVAHFWDAEGDKAQTYRWTRDTSTIELDAQNLAAPWTLRVRMNGYRPNRPVRVQVEMNGAEVDSFLAHDGWETYELDGNVPADALTGNDTLVFINDTFVPQNEIESSGDTRRLGVTVDWIELMPTRSNTFLGNDDVWIDFGSAPVLPPIATIASWAFAFALLYASARGIGLPKRIVNLVVATLVALLALGFAFVRPFLGYYTAPFLNLAIALAVLALLLVVLLPRLARRLRLAPDARALTSLSAIVLLSIGLKWGGASYPQFHSSDLLFHAHRLEFVANGNLFFTSQLPDAAQRAVPYPPSLYVALLPLTVFSQDYSSLFVVFDALADAIAIFAIYFAARKIASDVAHFTFDVSTLALFAALLFAFNPVSFWIYSWGNHTNIFAQDAATLLFALLLTQSLARPHNFLLALFFLILASLGHLGVFLSLLAFLPLAILLRFAARDENARREAIALGVLFVVGLLLGWALYYAEFTDVLLTQSQKFLNDFGAGRAAGRGGIMLARIGDVGRYTLDQLGLALVLLGLAGIPLAWKKFEARVRAIWGAWLLVGLAFALVTLGASFSTRYTLWAAPALALSGALALTWVLERGRALQMAAYALCTFAFGQTLWIWIDRVWNAYH